MFGRIQPRHVLKADVQALLVVATRPRLGKIKQSSTSQSLLHHSGAVHHQPQDQQPGERQPHDPQPHRSLCWPGAHLDLVLRQQWPETRVLPGRQGDFERHRTLARLGARAFAGDLIPRKHDLRDLTSGDVVLERRVTQGLLGRRVQPLQHQVDTDKDQRQAQRQANGIAPSRLGVGRTWGIGHGAHR